MRVFSNDNARLGKYVDTFQKAKCVEVTLRYDLKLILSKRHSCEKYYCEQGG